MGAQLVLDHFILFWSFAILSGFLEGQTAPLSLARSRLLPQSGKPAFKRPGTDRRAFRRLPPGLTSPSQIVSSPDPHYPSDYERLGNPFVQALRNSQSSFPRVHDGGFPAGAASTESIIPTHTSATLPINNQQSVDKPFSQQEEDYMRTSHDNLIRPFDFFESRPVTETPDEQNYTKVFAMMMPRQETYTALNGRNSIIRIMEEKKTMIENSCQVLNYWEENSMLVRDLSKSQKVRVRAFLCGLMTLNRRILKVFLFTNKDPKEENIRSEETLLMNFLKDWFKEKNLPSSPIISPNFSVSQRNKSMLDKNVRNMFFRFLNVGGQTKQIAMLSLRQDREHIMRVAWDEKNSLSARLAVGVLQQHYHQLNSEKFESVFEKDPQNTFLDFLVKLSLQSVKFKFARWRNSCLAHSRLNPLFPWKSDLKQDLSPRFLQVLFSSR
ncbi:hypothetical protein O181_010554 [Austropuccinia psidii MF-1]|uniref:Uncharacterized protein n=1 Tax=Austropuccinia psidii MF-1 TaxID=1389203 RepID=A0A9Q3BSV2_9BASI|nr:hypothetical protein [Austropuccinia psidii MF-1]